MFGNNFESMTPSDVHCYSSHESRKKFEIPLWEIEEITAFLRRHRHSISPAEDILLDRLLTRYERDGTLQARQELKTFLLYLRRAVRPTPSSKKFRPQVIDLDDVSPLKPSSVTFSGTPRRPPPLKCLRNGKSSYGRKLCTCKKCLHQRNVRRSKSCNHISKIDASTSVITVPSFPHSGCASSKSSFIGTLKALKNTFINPKKHSKRY